MSSVETLEPSQHPEAVAALLQDDVPVPEPAPGLIDLPGGVLDTDGITVHRTAEVRELTGLDEEVMARGANKSGQIDLGRYLEIIFERALVKVGPYPADDRIRKQMLIGDKDAVLLGIRIATYGPEYETTIVCPKCGAESRVAFELLKDIKWRNLPDPDRVYCPVQLRHGEAEVRLPTVGDQSLAFNDPQRTIPEVNTILFAQCVRSINGQPTLGQQTMRDLGMADRKAILDHISQRSPGPRMGEVVAACPVCNEESEMALNMAALFL